MVSAFCTGKWEGALLPGQRGAKENAKDLLCRASKAPQFFQVASGDIPANYVGYAALVIKGILISNLSIHRADIIGGWMGCRV